MSDYPGAPAKRSSLGPWLIGCALVVVLGIVGLGGAGYYWFTSSFFFEAAGINALASDIVPGAKAPEGYEPAWGMDTFGVKMAVFGPPGLHMGEQDDTAATMIIVASGEQGNDAAVRSSMRESARGEGQGVSEVTELGSEVIAVGGVDVSFEKSRGTQEGVEVLFFVAELPVRGNRQPMIMIMGPEESFDREAMDAFLAGIGPLATSGSETGKKPAREPPKTGK